jgi:ribonuclease P protein component
MGENVNFNLPKSERLCNIKLIEDLYKSPSFVKAYPIIFSYKTSDFQFDAPFQILFTVPKRNFKSAVNRNRIKRILRDRFRLNKQQFSELFTNRKGICSLVYTAKELPDYQIIDASIKKILIKLKDEIGS